MKATFLSSFFNTVDDPPYIFKLQLHTLSLTIVIVRQDQCDLLKLTSSFCDMPAWVLSPTRVNPLPLTPAH